MAGCAALHPPYGSLQLERLQLDPAALAMALVAGFGDLDLQQVVALDPVRPGRGDLRQDATFELENREGVVLDIDIVPPAGFIDTLRKRGHMAAGNGGNRPQQPVEDVAPMREHIEDQ